MTRYSATGKKLTKKRDGKYYTRKNTLIKRTYPTPAGKTKKASRHRKHKRHHSRKH
jgi:hypothetical protein